MLLELTPDELLTTTRAVRKRLDLTRPVEREVLEECLALPQIIVRNKLKVSLDMTAPIGAVPGIGLADTEPGALVGVKIFPTVKKPRVESC